MGWLLYNVSAATVQYIVLTLYRPMQYSSILFYYHSQPISHSIQLHSFFRIVNTHAEIHIARHNLIILLFSN